MQKISINFRGSALEAIEQGKLSFVALGIIKALEARNRIQFNLQELLEMASCAVPSVFPMRDSDYAWLVSKALDELIQRHILEQLSGEYRLSSDAYTVEEYMPREAVAI